MSDYDVVVVGGRVAGASTAMLLARAGLRVAVARPGAYGHRHPVDPRPDAGRRAAAVPLGAARPRSSRRHPAGPQHHVPLRAATSRSRSRSGPSAGVDALYAPAPAPARPDAGRRRRRGRRRGAARRPRSPACSATTPAASPAWCPATGRDARASSVAAPSSSAPTASARSVAQRGRRTRRTAGAAAASAVLYALRRGLDADGLRVGVRQRRRRRADPDQRRAETCVFVATTPERMRSLRRAAASGRGFDAALAAGRTRARPTGCAGATRGSRRCTAGAACPGSCGVRGARAGRWSATPATSRTRSPRTASPTRCATPSCWPTRVLAALGRRRPSVALAEYQATRDRLSDRLFEVTEEVAPYDWDDRRGASRCCAGCSRDERRGRATWSRCPTGTATSTDGPTRLRSASLRAADYRGRGTRMCVDICDCSGASRSAVDGAPVPADAWSRRGAASLVKLLALADGPPAAPRAGDRRAVARRHASRPPARGCTRPPTTPGARSVTHGSTPWSLRHDQVLLLPTTDVDGRRRSSSAAAAEAALADRLGRRRASRRSRRTAGSCCPRTSTSPGPPSARDAARGAARATCCAWPGAGRSCSREDPTDEEAHLALARAARRAGRPPRGAAPARADGPGAAPRARAPCPAPRRGGCAASSPRRRRERPRARPSRARHGWSGRASVGDYDPRAGWTGPTPAAAAPCCSPASAGRRQDRRARPGRGPGRGGGAGGSRAAARVGRRGAWPYAPVLEAFGDLCRQHPALLDGLDDSYRRRARPRAVRPARSPGAARPRTSGCSSPRPSCSGWPPAGHGLLLVVDDVHEADEASLRLLHYLARCAVTEPVRDRAGRTGRDAGAPAQREADSLVARGVGDGRIELGAARRGRDPSAARAPLPRPRRPDDGERDLGGLAAGCRSGPGARARTRPGRRGDVAVSGLPADATGDVSGGWRCSARRSPPTSCSPSPGSTRTRRTRSLDGGAGAAVVEPAETGYRFRHALVRDALLATAIAPHERSRAGGRGRRAAGRARRAGRPGWPTCSSPPGIRSQAVPYALRAVETAGALGAYRDGLALLDAVGRPRRPATTVRHLLARRGDLLLALGDPAAVDGVPRGPPGDHRHRAPAGPGPAGPGGAPSGRPRHRRRGARRPRARG